MPLKSETLAPLTDTTGFPLPLKLSAVEPQSVNITYKDKYASLDKSIEEKFDTESFTGFRYGYYLNLVTLKIFII